MAQRLSSSGAKPGKGRSRAGSIGRWLGVSEARSLELAGCQGTGRAVRVGKMQVSSQPQALLAFLSGLSVVRVDFKLVENLMRQVGGCLRHYKIILLI